MLRDATGIEDLTGPSQSLACVHLRRSPIISDKENRPCQNCGLQQVRSNECPAYLFDAGVLGCLPGTPFPPLFRSFLLFWWPTGIATAKQICHEFLDLFWISSGHVICLNGIQQIDILAKAGPLVLWSRNSWESRKHTLTNARAPCTHARTCAHTHMHTKAHLSAHRRTHTHTHTLSSTWAHMGMRAPTHTHTHTYAWTHAQICKSKRTRMHARMHVCTYCTAGLCATPRLCHARQRMPGTVILCTTTRCRSTACMARNMSYIHAGACTCPFASPLCSRSSRLWKLQNKDCWPWGNIFMQIERECNSSSVDLSHVNEMWTHNLRQALCHGHFKSWGLVQCFQHLARSQLPNLSYDDQEDKIFAKFRQQVILSNSCA